MNEIVMSWGWFARAVAGALIASLIGGPIVISKQLTRIAELLTQITDKKHGGGG